METGTTLVSNDLEDLVSQRTRSLAGTTNAPTDAVFEELYNAFHDVSRGLANDVVDTVLQTPGIEHLVPAFWNQVGDGPLALKVNSESTVGSEWTPDFELALKLLKSGLTTSVAMHVDGIGQASLDTHLEGHALHYQRLRGTFDVIGRMLAEMAMTPLSNGKSLLDDTLVLVTSELGRTFPMSGSCDHWAYNSYLVAGGGVYPNRMCGGYDVDTGIPLRLGFLACRSRY